MPRKFILLIFIFVLVISGLIVAIIGSTNRLPEPQMIADMQIINNNPAAITANQQIKFSAEIIELTNDQGQNYFVNYRIKREYFRQETKEMLRLLIESDIKDTRVQAQENWLELSVKIAKEGEIENALKMKGFKDVVSEVHKQRVNVIILAGGLKQQEITLIKSVAANITGYSQDRIDVNARA